MTFSELRLAEPILKSLQTEGYEIPTPIQAQAIPHVLAGKDLLGCAQTGTGKTAAFALPILHRLNESKLPSAGHGRRAVRALILSPTRELAVQIDESFRVYGTHLGFSHATVFGGVSQHRQTDALRRGVDILVATPGRLLDLIQQKLCDLSRVEVLVLDEADRMLDMGFIIPIRRIITKLPAERQTLMFSATMPSDIRELAGSILKNPAQVTITPVASTVDKIDQSVYLIDRKHKPQLLAHLINNSPVSRALVFVRTKHGADRVVKQLERSGIKSAAIHGNKSQNARQRALHEFKTGKTPILVASDIASRGIDVDDISHVFNYDLTHEPETYVHRIGRTARAGAEGRAISFCDHDERGNLRAIEKLIRKAIRVNTDLPKFVEPEPVAGEAKPRRQERPHLGAARQAETAHSGGNSHRREDSHRGSSPQRAADSKPRPNAQRREPGLQPYSQRNERPHGTAGNHAKPHGAGQPHRFGASAGKPAHRKPTGGRHPLQRASGR